MTLATLTPFHTLRRHLDGPCIDRDQPGWDAATQAFNLAVLQEPAAVVYPAHERDVIAVVEFAREYGLQVAPQRTGHNAQPLGPLDDVILLRTDALRGVELDFGGRSARVRAGATWADVIPAASALGLAGLHGPSPDVSVVGHALGGGVGFYARMLGLAANSVSAVELVTGDGRLRRVDHDHDPELFWALRGGGGSFGVVTALELDLYHLPEVYAGVVFFDWERARDVLHAWLDWTATVPDEVTSVARLLQPGGRRLAAVEAVVVGDEYDGAEWLRPLRSLGPVIDTFAMVPPAAVAELRTDPRGPRPYAGSGQLLGALSPAAIDAFAEAAGPGSGSPLVSAEIRHAGGAIARPAAGHGALGTLDAQFLTYAVGTVFDEFTHRAVHERLERVEAAFAPHDTGRRYLNLTECPTDPARFFTPEAYGRLQAVRAAVDPDGVLRSNDTIGPLG